MPFIYFSYLIAKTKTSTAAKSRRIKEICLCFVLDVRKTASIVSKSMLLTIVFFFTYVFILVERTSF